MKPVLRNSFSLSAWSIVILSHEVLISPSKVSTVRFSDCVRGMDVFLMSHGEPSLQWTDLCFYIHCLAQFCL